MTRRKTSHLPRIPDLIAGLVDPRLHGARCTGRAPLFDAELPDESVESRSARLAWARGQCARCPVQSACRTAAAELSNPSGVWAGTARGLIGRPTTNQESA
ncbi:WhiB family transcriptional regulator [Rhodococcus artemisiae]|uniref:WhiB family transcriptional regulator n=1 Tax=Rhodococcus artemisiae TaxID=714159 RepID=A0ABU7L9P6_9NOCA|nr:WhiB family transcriptional regulator [Rhodococcus artemisiae]MEE2058268.1 WhiB family transcriptional regulator [Rhodococcus artemisiae]